MTWLFNGDQHVNDVDTDGHGRAKVMNRTRA